MSNPFGPGGPMGAPAAQPIMGQPPPGFRPGQQPTPEQVQQMQQQFAAEAARQGLTPQQFADRLRQHAMAQRAQMQAQGQMPPGAGAGPGAAQGPPGAQGPQGGQGQQQGPPQGQQQMQQQQQQQQMARPGGQIPIQPGPPKPEALAVAKFLRSQDLKSRPCIFEEKRRDLFKVKRAIRALNSPAYNKARSKNPLLPEITDRASAENVFKLLPISMLALRVSRFDPSQNPAHGQPGHQHGGGASAKKGKDGKKPLWVVKIEPQQEAADEFHYIWFYEGAQWRQKLYAGGALLGVIAVVLFPLWPYALRRGVWYLSMGCVGLLGLFFALAIVRLILFLVTIVTGPKPGIWLFPNLFEDVGFFDSFKPVWAWRETAESIALLKSEKKAKRLAKRNRRLGITSSPDATSTPSTANGKSITEQGEVSQNSDLQGEVVEKVGGMNGVSGGSTGVEANDNEAGTVQKRAPRAVVEDAGDDDEESDE